MTDRAEMSIPEPGEVTRLLGQAGAGDAAAAGALVEVLYAELRELARRCLAGERRGHTLQATALVHEAYLRLVSHPDRTWENRNHFFASAAVAIRRILVDHARRRARRKRGGHLRRVPLTPDLEVIGADVGELLAVDEALRRLAVFDPQKARVVELRFFAGLTVDEAAAVIGVSPSTVARDWRVARAWLRSELDGVRRGVSREAPS